MPFLKFSRDKRGYENYSLFDGKGRARLLFWFRTPPDVKVGRVAAFPDDVRRMVEAQNPGVFFDWPRILATPIPSPDVDKWRERRRVEKLAKRAAREAEAEDAELAAAEAAEAAAALTAAEPAALEELAGAEAEADVVSAVEAEAESASGASDVQDAQPGQQGQPDLQGAEGQQGPQGHRRRRRRRRGRRGGGQPQPQGVVGSATDVTAVTDAPREAEPSSEPETAPDDEV